MFIRKQYEDATMTREQLLTSVLSSEVLLCTRHVYTDTLYMYTGRQAVGDSMAMIGSDH